MSSSQTRDSQDESNNTNESTSNSPFEHSQSEFTTNNTNEFTELPQPAITRKHHSSMAQILDEIPPPPYSTASNMQMPTSSHSRNQTVITITSPPEYTASSSLPTITTQPQVIPHPSHRRSISNETLLSKFCKICHESESSDDQDDDKLISPCKCKGSLQYVHIGCLNQWRHSNVRADASF